MADAQARRAEHDGAAWPNAGFEFMLALQKPAIEAFAAINTRFIEQVNEATVTWSSFLQGRFQEDMAVSQQLAGCQTAQDVVRVTSEFFQRAAKQYQDELAEMARLGQSFTSESAAIVREKVEEASRELKH